MTRTLLLPALLASLLPALALQAQTAGQVELPAPVHIVPERFSAAPPPGVHPRILISPEDLPALRERLKNTAAGKRSWQAIKGWLAGALGPQKRQGEPLKAAYEKLAAGDVRALEAIDADKQWWKDQMALTIQFEAFVSLIEEDATRNERAGKALLTYCRIAKGRNLKANLAHQFDASIGMAYDFAYGHLSEEDRKALRAMIAQATFGKESHGMGSPAARHTYNFMPHGTGLLLLALAIEGEEGYDPTIYTKSVTLMKNFLNHGVDATGDPQEDMHYFNFGMAWGSQAMVAMARRGDNLFLNDHYRRLPNWYINEMEPFGQAFSMLGDTPNDGGGLMPNYITMKWVWPDDPVVDLVWRNRARLDYSGISYRGDFLYAALFARDWKNSPDEIVKLEANQWGANTDKDTPVALRSAEALAGVEALGLPRSWMSDKRALFIARSAWGPDALVLHFSVNAHNRGPSHTHANALDITLSALGRKWVIDRGFHIAESRHHSVILIDGKGQGFSAPPGKPVSHADDGALATVSGDAKYAYDWMYEFGNRIGNDYRKGNPWEPETANADTLAMYREMAAPEYKERPWEQRGDDSGRPGLEGFTHKAPCNPVEKAFRSVALRRGEHPYLLVADNIRKDDASHRYEWPLQVCDDLVIVDQTPTEVILGSEKPGDERRLLVRMLGASPAADAGKWTLETYEIARSPETGSDKKFGTGKRLVYTMDTVEPAFRVLLLPHIKGETLPKTEAGQAEIRVTFPGGDDDRYTVGQSPEGAATLTHGKPKPADDR